MEMRIELRDKPTETMSTTVEVEAFMYLLRGRGEAGSPYPGAHRAERGGESSGHDG